MGKENIQIDHRLKKYSHIDWPDFKLTEESINTIKGNPNAPTRQFFGRAKTPEQDKQYRKEALKKPVRLNISKV